jgi:hypothetical protein
VKYLNAVLPVLLNVFSRLELANCERGKPCTHL